MNFLTGRLYSYDHKSSTQTELYVCHLWLQETQLCHQWTACHNHLDAVSGLVLTISCSKVLINTYLEKNIYSFLNQMYCERCSSMALCMVHQSLNLAT